MLSKQNHLLLEILQTEELLARTTNGRTCGVLLQRIFK